MLLINLAIILVFILPIAIYVDKENTQNYIKAVDGALVVVFLAPPIGPYRPHPYSDWEGNKPISTLRE